MPRKMRELKRDLRHAGYYQVKGGGKGSHTKWRHPLVPGSVTLSGADGDDAKPPQEDDVREAVRKAKEAERRQKP
jgi:predicted RNA binding protein YcfA (HicA-like mRNA interferase family)